LVAQNEKRYEFHEYCGDGNRKNGTLQFLGRKNAANKAEDWNND
jgi:hypothetical protein